MLTSSSPEISLQITQSSGLLMENQPFGAALSSHHGQSRSTGSSRDNPKWAATSARIAAKVPTRSGS
jgi:hypothetical protein